MWGLQSVVTFLDACTALVPIRQEFLDLRGVVKASENISNKQFSTGVLQEFFKLAIHDYLVSGMTSFPLDFANMTVAVQCEFPVLKTLNTYMS